MSHTPGPWTTKANGYRNQMTIEPCIGAVYGAGEELKAPDRQLEECLEHYRKLAEKNEQLDRKVVSLEASQTRWVKCSERLPEKEGKYVVLIAEDGIISTMQCTWYCSGKFRGWLFNKYNNQKIIAWLENVPEFKP